jgi:hypothetical protein
LLPDTEIDIVDGGGLGVMVTVVALGAPTAARRWHPGQCHAEVHRIADRRCELTGTTMFLAVASPSAQLNVPLCAVKFSPAVAVPLLVA